MLRPLILDCWMLYLHKNFKNKALEVQLKHFPMWNNSKVVKKNIYNKKNKIHFHKHLLLFSKLITLNLILLSQFKFHLYVEVKKTPKTDLLEEIKNEKRIWMKVDDITNEIYKKHFKTKISKMNILSTKDYMPDYLKGFENKNRKRKRPNCFK